MDSFSAQATYEGDSEDKIFYLSLGEQGTVLQTEGRSAEVQWPGRMCACACTPPQQLSEADVEMRRGLWRKNVCSLSKVISESDHFSLEVEGQEG